MSTIAKTVVATGCSSGLGFELVKQLLEQTQPYRFILGARDAQRTQKAYDDLKFDIAKHSLTIYPLELSDLRTTKSFAQQALSKLSSDGNAKLDYLLLNAGMAKGAGGAGSHGSKWCDSLVVNHLSQHYLTHLLREKLAADRARIVVVSSGAVRGVRDGDPKTLDIDLLVQSGTDGRVIYSGSKFVQLLGAHYWRRQLQGSATIVAVSPGLIPNTGLARGLDVKLTMDMPDAKTVPQGAQNILRAFTRDDFPEDPDQIFLTSWGEWWAKDMIGLSLDKELQDKWCPSKDDIQMEGGMAA